VTLVSTLHGIETSRRIDETMSSSPSGAEVAGDPGPIGHVLDLAMLHHHFHHSPCCALSRTYRSKVVSSVPETKWTKVVSWAIESRKSSVLRIITVGVIDY